MKSQDLRNLTKDLCFRGNVFRNSASAALSRQRHFITEDFQTLVGISSCALAPRKYSVAHLSTARTTHPYGTTWRPLGTGEKICSQCRCGYPVDFVRFAERFERWNPGAASAEIDALIERGEITDTEDARNRWRNIPEGAMILYTSGLTTETVMLTAISNTGEFYSMSIAHLVDLPSKDLDIVSEFFAEKVPEWAFSRNTQGGIRVVYNPGLDVMLGMTANNFRFNPNGTPEISVVPASPNTNPRNKEEA